MKIDKAAVKAIIEDTKRLHEETSAIGQPYTVRHFENLEFVIRYLEKYLKNDSE